MYFFVYIVGKKASRNNIFEFANELILEKKLKGLHFKRDLFDANGFNYLKKNDLYESIKSQK